jgi:hypothetical protein
MTRLAPLIGHRVRTEVADKPRCPQDRRGTEPWERPTICRCLYADSGTIGWSLDARSHLTFFQTLTATLRTSSSERPSTRAIHQGTRACAPRARQCERVFFASSRVQKAALELRGLGCDLAAPVACGFLERLRRSQPFGQLRGWQGHDPRDRQLRRRLRPVLAPQRRRGAVRRGGEAGIETEIS